VKAIHIPRPWSLPNECWISDCAFYFTGTGLIMCEVEKAIKPWRQSKDNGQQSRKFRRDIG
jgi:hypothetical protein